MSADNECGLDCQACSGEVCMTHAGPCECDTADRHVNERTGAVFVGDEVGMRFDGWMAPTAPAEGKD